MALRVLLREEGLGNLSCFLLHSYSQIPYGKYRNSEENLSSSELGIMRGLERLDTLSGGKLADYF